METIRPVPHGGDERTSLDRAVSGAPAQPAKQSLFQIDQYAENIYNTFAPQFSQSSGALKIHDLVAKFGGSIHVEDAARAAESMHVLKPQEFKIFIPPFTSPRRDRFTIAHEFGHYCLHYPWDNSSSAGEMKFNRPLPLGSFSPTLNRNIESSKINQLLESQANRFAAALLMPREKFVKASADGCGIADLAAMWDVSEQAVQVRAKTLNISLNRAF